MLMAQDQQQNEGVGAMDSDTDIVLDKVPTVTLAMPLILLVEDDHAVASVTIELLEDLGFSVQWAPNGVEALRWMRGGGKPILVFSDILMPLGVTGIELAAVLKNEFPGLPVLLTSGYADKAELAASTEWPLLDKPYTREELARAIWDALGFSPDTIPN